LVLVSTTAYVACQSSTDDREPAGGAGSPSGASGAGGGGKSGASGSSGTGTGEAGEGSDPSGEAGSGGSAGEAGSGGEAGEAPGGSESAGAVTFETFAFYQPSLLFDADGVLHMAFNLNTGPSQVQYARCAADCGVGSNWETTIIDTHNTTGRVRMVIGTDKRLHMIYDTSDGGSASGLIYATCASDCTDAGNWVKTELASLFGGSWNSPSNGAPLVIDANNRLTFTVDRKIWLNGGLTLATCAANCSTLSNWSAGTIRSGGTRTSLAARGTTLHQLVDNDTTTTDATALSYRTCSANCTNPASWQELPDMFAYDGLQATAIAVTANDEVRIVYNQGVSGANQSAAVKAQDNKMLIWGCDADCLDAKSWSGFSIGNAGDGAEGIAMAELGGALVLSVTNTSRVLTRYCTENCLVDSNWDEAIIDSTDELTATYDPYTLTATTCVDRPPQSATWHLQQGAVAIRPDGALAFAHAAYLLRTCPLSSTVDYRPGYGRLVFAP